jgi:alpha-ketoglutarate-dependent taurine dioxygenase
VNQQEDLEHIDDVSRKHIVDFFMQSGDMLLIDNYRVLHGRDIFEGDRLHAVSWFRKVRLNKQVVAQMKMS